MAIHHGLNRSDLTVGAADTQVIGSTIGNSDPKEMWMMGAFQPVHLLILLAVLAFVAAVVTVVVVLVVKLVSRSGPAPVPPSGQLSLAELADLHERGALTDEEFTAAKRQVLDR